MYLTITRYGGFAGGPPRRRSFEIPEIDPPGRAALEALRSSPPGEPERRPDAFVYVLAVSDGPRSFEAQLGGREVPEALRKLLP